MTKPTRTLKSRARPGLASVNRRWHLARDAHEVELTEFEYAALRMHAAFQRWNEAVVVAAGGKALTFTEASMLHVVRMQDRPKGVSLIAELLNREDLANLQYGLRKLRRLGLIRTTGGRSRKRTEYEVTPSGRELTDRIAAIADELIVNSTRGLAHVDERLIDGADLLRLMTGIFDEGARVARTFTAADGLPGNSHAGQRSGSRKRARPER